jgi:YDG domain/Secretion system C-terminal sorting domain
MNLSRLIKPICVLAFLLASFTPWQLAAQNATCENVKTIPNEGIQTETNTGQSAYWYSFQTPNDGQNRDLTVSALGNTVSILNFPCAAISLITASAPGFGLVTASNLLPNTAYLIRIEGVVPGMPFILTSFSVTTVVSSGGGGGGGSLNNTCGNAIVINATGTQIVTNTSEAEYWFQFIMPSAPSNLELSSDQGANIPVTVYTGVDCNSLTIRAQGTSASAVTVTTLTPNSVVWIKWGAQLGTTGSFVLNALPTGGGGGGGANQAPTNILLDKTTLNSSDGAFTVVGNLSTTDPNMSDTFTYTLVSGAGDTDNASFDIFPLPVVGGAQLVITVPANTKATYSVRIRSTDFGGLFFEKAFTITVNSAQTQLTISGLTAANKVYNGNNTATLTGTATLNGIANGDVVTLTGTPIATFDDAEAGSNKPVTITGYTLSGTNSGNYSLTQPTGLTANITKADQTITFNAITASIEVGGSPLPLGATATSSLPISYSATPADRITIALNGNATPSLNVAGNVEITASQAGNNNYNAATSVKQTVCIAPKAPIVITQTQGGSEVLTTATAQSLSWFKEGTASSVATGSVFNPSSQTQVVGTYFAKVDAGDGCMSKPSNKFIVSIITGLEPLSQLASIWPNPATDYLFVDNVSAEAKGQIVQLNGTMLELPGQYTNNRLQLDVRALTPGMYVLKVVDGNTIRTARIVKN